MHLAGVLPLDAGKLFFGGIPSPTVLGNLVALLKRILEREGMSGEKVFSDQSKRQGHPSAVCPMKFYAFQKRDVFCRLHETGISSPVQITLNDALSPGSVPKGDG